MFSISYLVFNPFVGGLLSRIGRKRALTIGFFILIVTTLGFALLEFIYDE